VTPEPPEPLASHAGLREVDGAFLGEELVRGTAARFVALLRERGLRPMVTVARDERARSADVAEMAVDGAAAAGADVWELGVLSTPASKLSARELGAGGGIMVTGSHLGPHLTGMKLSSGPDFIPVDIRSLPAENGSAARGSIQPHDGGAEAHAAAVAASVDASTIRSAGLRVHLFGGAGASGPALLETLGCEEAHLPDADLGLELDADADRLTLIGEDSEATLPLVALARPPRTLVRSTDTSRMVDLLLGGGAEVRAVSPGELHLVEALQAAGSSAGPLLAGEGNGGVVVPEVGLARDGLAAGARILELLARSGRPLRKHLDGLPRLVRRRSTVPIRSATPVTVEREGGLWGLVRPSATEPVVRITVEGPDAAQVDALHEELRAAVEAT
jgi:phosphomannomutase